MGPRLIATDLDGTIVRSDGTISDRTVAALARVEAAGAEVMFVTGRPSRWLAPVARDTGHRGLAICSNGAAVYDLAREQVVETYPMALDAARRVAEAIQDAVPGAAFAVETTAGYGYEPGWQNRLPSQESGSRRAELDVLLDAPVLKLLVQTGDGDADTLLGAVRVAIGEQAEPTHSGLYRSLVEIGAAGVSKATTLARWCDEHGVVASEVVAFGDMPNDLPLLAWAGTAWAVANAHSDVLGAVDHVTASNNDDGVAMVIEELF